MSTNAHIGILENGNITYIYNHFDGYVSNVGHILYNHYNDPEKLKELLALGDISSLGECVSREEYSDHSSADSDINITIAYHRDYGEDFERNKARILKDITGVYPESVIRKYANKDIEFAYLYNVDSNLLEKEKWFYFYDGRGPFDLEKDVKD